MSVTMTIGVALQALAVGVILAALRGRAWLHVGFYLPVMIFVYHGLTEILQAAGAPSPYRTLDPPGAVDAWTVLVGGASLLFAVCYLFVVLRAPTDREPARVLDVLPWPLLAAAAVPLAVIAGRGGIGNTAGVSHGAGYTSGGLAAQFIAPLTALAAVSFIARGGRWRFLTGLLAQLVAVSLVGQRLAVIQGAAMTLFGLGMLRAFPNRRQILAAALVCGAVAVGISAARDQVGRAQFDASTSAPQRVSYLARGLGGAIEGKPSQQQTQPQSFAARIDGNSFPAYTLNKIDRGASTVGLTTLGIGVREAVPSFLYPSKSNLPLVDSNEKAYLNAQYGYVGGAQDFLATQFGALLTYYGPFGLLVLAMLLGVGFGAVDVWLRHVTAARLVVAVVLLSSVLDYEGTIDGYTVQLRGAVVLAVILTAAARLRGRRARQAPAPAARPGLRARRLSGSL